MARRVTPDRFTSILAIRGEWMGNFRSTPFALHDPPHGERRARAGARPGDHQAVENLDAFLLAFENSAVNVDGVANLEW